MGIDILDPEHARNGQFGRADGHRLGSLIEVLMSTTICRYGSLDGQPCTETSDSSQGIDRTRDLIVLSSNPSDRTRSTECNQEGIERCQSTLRMGGAIRA